MPIYIDDKGNFRQVPEGKEELFVKVFPGGRPATEEELLKKEENRMKSVPASSQESNIRKAAGYLPGTFKPQAVEIPKMEGLNPFPSKTFEDQAKEVISQTDLRDRNKLVSSAITEDQSYKRWIEGINSDDRVSPGVKRELTEWYRKNFRDTDNPASDIRIPSSAKEYLDKNKQEVERSVYVQGSPMFGGGTYQKGIVKENTPKQMAEIADFLVNSPKGRAVVEEERMFLEKLDQDIDELESKMLESAKRREEMRPKSGSLKEILMRPKWEAEKEKEEYARAAAKAEEDVPFGDLINAQNQLNELKKLRKAYQDGDRNAISQFAREFGRRSPYDLVNAGTAGFLGLTEEAALSGALKDSKNKLTREAHDLIGEYQQAHAMDRSIAQDIAQGTSYMLPFVAQFIASEGAVAAATKLPDLSKLSKGMRFAMKASETAQRPLVRMAITPQLMVEAYRNSIENPGSFLDAFARAVPSTYVEFFTEDLGRYIPEPKPKNKTVRKLMESAGVQGGFGEMMEEEVGMLLQPLVDGSYDWSAFVDPRNQVVTAGTIATMQLPYASIAAGGYAAGKYRNIKQKRSIRKAYDSNLKNLQSLFGEESEEVMKFINSQIDADIDGTSIPTLVCTVIEDKEMSQAQKDALVKYGMSYLAQSPLGKAKEEQVNAVTQEAVETVEENVNPEMNAVVSAVIAGNDGPLQVVSGNIVQREDGTIDREASDKEIYYVDQEGNRVVTSIEFVESISEIIPTEEAKRQAVEIAAAPVIAQQENDEVRLHEPGESVWFSQDGVVFQRGEVVGLDEQTGMYSVNVETPAGVMPMQVEPRLINDNLSGVDNEIMVNYQTRSGEMKQGEVTDMYGLLNQGLVVIGEDVVPVANVLGVVEEEVNEGFREEHNDSNLIENNAENADAPAGGAEEVSVESQEQRLNAIIEAAPKQKDGAVDYDALLEANPEAFAELYSAEEGVEDTIGELSAVTASIDRKIETEKKKLENADSINKRKAAKAAIAELQAKKEMISGVVDRLSEDSKDFKDDKGSKDFKDDKGSKDFKEGDVVSPEINSEEERLMHIAQNGTDVQEIAGAYGEAMRAAEKESLQDWQKALLGRRVNRSSFERFGDKNHVTGTIARFWFNTKGEEGVAGTIDTIAEELGVSEQDVIDFILDHPSNRVKKGNELTKALNDRFKQVARELTGEDVGGIESASGRMLLKGLEIAQSRPESISADINQEIPDSLLYFLEAADIDIENIHNFDELQAAVDESKATLWQLSEEDFSEIDNFIHHARQTETYARTSERIQKAVSERAAIADFTEQQESRSDSARSEGAEIPERVSQGRYGERNEVDRGMEEDSAHDRGRESPTGQARQAISGVEGKQEQLKVLEEYAKENGIWIEDADLLGVDGGLYPIDTQIQRISQSERSSDFDVSEYQGKELYHGSPDGKLSMIDPYAHSQNWKEGIGFYTTENMDKAQEYANGKTARGKRKGQKGDVTTVVFPNDARILDMDAPASAEIWSDIADNMGVPVDMSGSNMEAYNSIIEAYRDETGTTEGQYAVEEALSELGYDASTHIEGKGSVPHRVFIWKNEFKLPEISKGFKDSKELKDFKDGKPVDIIALANEAAKKTEIEQAEAEVDTNPTEAQKEAGNYKKGHVNIQGFDISIEQPKGSVRSGKDASGKEWSVTMQNTYGYIRKTEGKDRDPIDVFIGDKPESKKVFVVDQINEDGSFDEHKVMIGFETLEDAKAAYLSNYEEGWQGLGNITEVDVDTFRSWAETDGRRVKPFAEYKKVQDIVGSLSTPLRKLEDGEFVHVERVFAEKGHFSFTGTERIESLDDVAYVFRSLEDASIENSFAVFVKDGHAIVQHLGMGGFVEVSVNVSAMMEAYRRINPDKVYFIHNHPSGQLLASPQDMKMYGAIKKAIGERLEPAIIINLKSGKYGVFDDYGSESVQKGDISNANEVPIKVFSFDKQVFSKDYSPENLSVVRSSQDVAEFLSGHRLGERNKIGFLILSRSNSIVGNLFTEFTQISEDNINEISERIAQATTTFGGASAVLYGRFPLDKSLKKVARLVEQKSGGELRLLEAINVNDSGYDSAVDSGVMEPEAKYEKESPEHDIQSVDDIAEAAGSSMSDVVRKELDMKLKSTAFRLREAWEDKHLAVKEFLDVLRKKGVEVAEYNDYYKQATHINGKNDAQLEHFRNTYLKPMTDAIAEMERAGFSHRDVENYAILKHGIERNIWMREDAIRKYEEEHPDASAEEIHAYIEKLPTDYSGLETVEEEVGMSAEAFIAAFEEKTGQDLANDFWQKVKAATKFALKKQYEGGLIDKRLFEELSGRWEHYIPLRGHDVETAEDIWDYSPEMGTYFVKPVIAAKGRRSRSETPFAYIAQMAQSAIVSSNKNELNKTILRLARKDKTGMLSVSKTWYIDTGGIDENGNRIYEMQEAEYSEDKDQYRKNIEAFEAHMKDLAEKGVAFQKKGKFDIGDKFIKPRQKEQHSIQVYENGVPYTVYINANPAVSRAINGMNAKSLNKEFGCIAKVSRQMAANFTTRNPLFVATNFSRDFIFSSSILPVKEGVGYTAQFFKNVPVSADALQRYVRGKADLNNKQDRYLNEYILNGAKTGFSHILELQQMQKQIERDIKNSKKGVADYSIRPVLKFLEAGNDFAENLSRLSVYITSREQGRSIMQSVSDAKEVTVNFNRSGAGGYGAQYIRPVYLFVNAGIQALSNFAKVAQKNKGKTAALISSYVLSGVLTPLITAMLGGDDGLDEYMKLSEWERQNNLCIYTGNGFIKIPLPHELRVFHKMGDEIYQAVTRNKDATEAVLDTTLGFADLIPANPMGAIQGSWAEVMPDALKPFFQLAANRNFTGGRITNEWADPNKPGYQRVRTNKKGEPFAPEFLVKLAESLDHATGGDGVEKGAVSFNPDELNHLVRGYFGGLYTMASQGLDIVSKTHDWSKTGELKIKVRETPLRTFYTSSDDLMTSNSGLNTRYFKVKDGVEESWRKFKGYQDQVKEGKIGIDVFSKKVQKLDIPKMSVLRERMKVVTKCEKALKDLEGEEQKNMERIIATFKEEVVNLNQEFKDKQ